MALPAVLRDRIEHSLGSPLLSAHPLSGGMINQAARVEVRDSSVFIKWNEQAPPGLFAAEAAGLDRLRATKTLRVPEVLAVVDEAPLSSAVPAIAPDLHPTSPTGLAPAGAPEATPRFLVLEFIEERVCPDPAVFARSFGEALATLHRSSTSPEGGFGLGVDNYLGRFPQLNRPRPQWSDFYRDNRLLPQIDLARQQERLSPELLGLLAQVLEQLDRLLEEIDARPALLHGDLWSGNFLQAGNTAVVIDPAIYYGEREVELAFVELFGGFPPGFMAAYQAAYPLDPGYRQRRPLHQLYPLLVHLNHFGAPYDRAVEQVCRRCLEQAR